MQVCLCGERKALQIDCRPEALTVYTSIPILSSTTLAKNFQMVSLRVQSCFFLPTNLYTLKFNTLCWCFPHAPGAGNR